MVQTVQCFGVMQLEKNKTAVSCPLFQSSVVCLPVGLSIKDTDWWVVIMIMTHGGRSKGVYDSYGQSKMRPRLVLFSRFSRTALTLVRQTARGSTSSGMRQPCLKPTPRGTRRRAMVTSTSSDNIYLRRASGCEPRKT